MQTINATIKGGEFLLKEIDPQLIFTPEDYTDEHVMLREAIRNFLDKEVEPVKEKFNTVEGCEVAPILLEKMGQLGFHGITVPEEYGGMNMNLKTDLAFGEIASDSFAFAQAVGVHAGLAIYPILLYGTTEQKEHFLPRLLTAEIKCSYCLTEPGAGSDAKAGKTQAITSDDGTHYIVTGQKMWISNAGFADFFSVFCKIDGDDKLSCLIIEKSQGVTLGTEEKKLGIHGASTRQVFFDQVQVPVDNLLGERSKGFEIAMNALNLGRIKIAVAGTAVAKRAFGLAVNYANKRVQFNQPIIKFGAIQSKIANMAARIYGIESAWNRVAHHIDETHEQLLRSGTNVIDAKIKSVAEFAIECSIAKVYGSEAEQYVVDEALQIHGGMGYSGESDIAILYKNIRGNRIYEGTNEINRILIPGMIIKKAMKGELAMMDAAMKTFSELQNNEIKEASNGENFTLETEFLSNCKKVSLLIMGQAIQKFQHSIKDEQEVMMNISDIVSQIFVFESALLRTMKHHQDRSAKVRSDILKILMHDTADLIKVNIKEIIFASAEVNAALPTLRSINKLLNLPAYNLKEARREIADYFKDKNGYSFG